MIIQCTDWVQSKQLTTKLMLHIFSVRFETNVHIFFSKIAILDYVQRWCHPGFVDGKITYSFIKGQLMNIPSIYHLESMRIQQQNSVGCYAGFQIEKSPQSRRTTKAGSLYILMSNFAILAQEGDNEVRCRHIKRQLVSIH